MKIGFSTKLIESRLSLVYYGEYTTSNIVFYELMIYNGAATHNLACAYIMLGSILWVIHFPDYYILN